MANDKRPGKTVGSQYERVLPVKSGNANWNVVSTKLVKPVLATGFGDGGDRLRKSKQMAPTTFINRVATNTGNSAVDTDNIMHLLPDMELAKQVLVSSIISPNNLMTNDLAFASSADDLGEVKGKLLEIIETHFIETYKIKPEVTKDLEAMLFTPGGKARMILPEATIDYAINGDTVLSTESFDKAFYRSGKPRSLGVLGRNKLWDGYSDEKVNAKDGWKTFLNSAAVPPEQSMQGYASESFKSDVPLESSPGVPDWLNFSVTDNYNVLAQPRITNEVRRRRLHQIYSPSWVTESADGGKKQTGRDIRNHFENNRPAGESAFTNDLMRLYPERSYEFTPTLHLKTLAELDRPTVGHPIVIDLPLESVIPVHAPGDPTKHVGYFVIVDKQGNPVHVGETRDWFADIQYQAVGTQEMSSRLLSQTRKASEGLKPIDLANMREEAAAIYQNIIESELVSSLQNGMMGQEVRISNVPDIFKMMFARACSRMQTQLIFVPAELMSYLAFDYNEFGVAEGLLDKTKVISGMRAALLFSDTIASMKNSVSHTELAIKLEPDDPEPEVTIEMIMHDYMRTRQSSYPLSASSPVDIIQYFDNAGINVSISGHPAYPDSALSVEPKNMQYAKVEPELQEMLRKQHLMSVGLAPETVDLSMNVDFATSVVSSNILLAKRALNYQTAYCEQKSQFIRIYTINSEILKERCIKIIEAGIDSIPLAKEKNIKPEVILMYFISSLTLSLPQPDVARVEMQQTELENYIKLIDTGLEFIIDPAFFTEGMLGELGQTIDQVKAAYRALHIRRWMMDNNILSELFDMVNPTADGKPGFTTLMQHYDYMKGLNEALMDFTRKSAHMAGANNKILAQIKEASGLTDAELGTGPSGGASDDGGGGGSDDDLGLDLDLDTDVEAGAEPGAGGGEPGGAGGPEPGGEELDEEGKPKTPPEEEPEPGEPA